MRRMCGVTFVGVCGAAAAAVRQSVPCHEYSKSMPKCPPACPPAQSNALTPGHPAVSHFTYTTEPNRLHGHFGFPPFSEEGKPCAPATCSAPADWAHNLIKVRGQGRGRAGQA